MTSLLVGGIILLAAVASAALATRIPPVVAWLDVGSPGDDGYTSLFFPPESNTDETFRWTSEQAELAIPTGRPGHYRLEIKLATVEPAGRSLAINCGGAEQQISLPDLGPDSVAVVECRTESDQLDVTLDVPVVHLPNGGRPLGVSIRDIQVTALDHDDRRAYEFVAWVTIFGSITGTFLVCLALFRNSMVASGVPAAAIFLAWAGLIDRYPDAVLSAVSGPGGLIALIAGLTAVLLRAGKQSPALALGVAAIATGLIWPQPEGTLVLESRWVMEELAALVVMPWLAILAVVAGALIAGRRGHWLAAVGALIGVLSLALPAIAARFVETRLVQITAPDWTEYGGIAGAIYVICVFAVVGLSIFAGRKSKLRPEVVLTLIAALGVTGLLLWRVQIMRFNGDEPHYYTTAWSLARDGDLELLNNYVSDDYREVTYSPIGNIAVERADDVFRYAAGTSGASDRWLMVPELPDGWEPTGDIQGIVPADRSPVFLRGPAGAIAALPALAPARQHAILLDEPCRVSALVVGQPDLAGAVQLDITVLGQQGETLWSGQAQAEGEIDEVQIPEESGLCVGSGTWTVQVETNRDVLIEALDEYNGLQIASGQLERGWIYSGLPRDRYGSTDVISRLLLHNPSEQVVQSTVRLLTASDQTVSEITIGLQPGQTVVEPLPVFGVTGVFILVKEEVAIATAFYGIVDGNRYRIPQTFPVDEMTLEIPANATYDSGIWLSLVNITEAPAQASIEQDGQSEFVEICPACAVVRLEPATDDPSRLTVTSLAGQPLAVTAVAYEERTGQLHYDIGLPLLAAPLTLFDPLWPVLLVTALAGILLAPGLYLLIKQAYPAPFSETFYFVAIVTMLAPISTYAVRFYTDLLAGTLIVWGLVLLERGQRSNRALAGVVLIALALPVLHGRLAVLAAGLLGLAILTGFQRNRERLAGYPARVLIPAALGIGLVFALAIGLFMSQYAVALGSRGIANFIHLSWVMPNTFGMLLDRGSGVLPFAPWVLFALAVPRPLHRTQRAALVLAIGYYGLLMLRAGGWQTWGSPIRYLLPVFPLVAALAIPGMVHLWRSRQIWKRALIMASIAWSFLAAILLHWLPLSGYIDRTTPGNDYLIDQALAWLPFRSPYAILPTIEALPGPGWGAPIGVALLIALAVWAVWVVWPLVRDSLTPLPPLPLLRGERGSRSNDR